MVKKWMNKKGELTTGQIISIVLVLLGFAILLFVWWQLNWTGKIDRDTCHTSVVFRATLPSIGGVQEYVPLKCKAEKVCISS